jgi:hypothetical protein
MANSIVRALIALFSRIFPPTGTRRAATGKPTSQPLRRPEPSRRLLPEHMSPYAREVAEMENGPIIDKTNPVRPYVLSASRGRPLNPRQRAQAERRWALDMALRGIDVGPAMIHGVHVRPDARTVRVAVGV